MSPLQGISKEELNFKLLKIFYELWLAVGARMHPFCTACIMIRSPPQNQQNQALYQAVD